MKKIPEINEPDPMLCALLDAYRKKRRNKKKSESKEKKKINDIILGTRGRDRRFELVETIDIAVPDDYHFESCLDAFSKKHKKDLVCLDAGLIDANFTRASVRLKPGQKLNLKIFKYLNNVPARDSINLLLTEKGLLAGAQGISLVCDILSDRLPKEGLFASFDKKEALWTDAEGEVRIPVLEKFLSGKIAFRLGYFDTKMRAGDYLLCLCERS